MKKVFNSITTIEMTNDQASKLDNLVCIATQSDKNKEVLGIFLSMADTTNTVLNEEFCPIVLVRNAAPSDELYETVKEKCSPLPEYVSREEELPEHFVTLWAREV